MERVKHERAGLSEGVNTEQKGVLMTRKIRDAQVDFETKYFSVLIVLRFTCSLETLLLQQRNISCESIVQLI